MKPLLLSLFLFFYCYAFPQSISFDEYARQINEEFENYSKVKNSEFEEYRNRINEEFANFMEKNWPKYETAPAIPVPLEPTPPDPYIADPDMEAGKEQLPFAKIKPLPQEKPKPEPVLPPNPQTPLSPTPDIPKLAFNYYGLECIVPFDPSLKFNLNNIDEQSVANVWKLLSSSKSVELIKSSVDYRESLGLSDWAYVRFIEKMAEAIYPSKVNEATLLKFFLLTQSGYKVRIGRNNNQLVMLLPSDGHIYNYPYIPIDGSRYYIMNKNATGTHTYLYDRKFPKEQTFSLSMETLPDLPLKKTEYRHLESGYDRGISVDVCVNQNLIDFFNEYPLNDSWNLYAKASLSDYAKKQLYPKLLEAIENKTEKEAANILLRFVQKAFKYATDDQQFGEERPLFADESLYYPYNDCEDRSIFYSILVKDLLGLDVVMLYYPGHLATAVNFNSDVTGDFFLINDKKYIVCDPTYINSNIGMAMPSCKTINAEIIRIY